MNGHLTDHVKTVRVMNAVAAGTTDQNGSSVDMTGFDAVRFILGVGTLTASQVTSMKAQQSTDDSAWSDIADSDSGNLDDADDNDLVVTDLIRPATRYVRPVVLRGTANAVIDFVIAELYRARDVAVTQDSTVVKSEKLVTPIAGTA